jgi:Diguanylate cyclase, GGDEF domain
MRLGAHQSIRSSRATNGSSVRGRRRRWMRVGPSGRSLARSNPRLALVIECPFDLRAFAVLARKGRYTRRALASARSESTDKSEIVQGSLPAASHGIAKPASFAVTPSSLSIATSRPNNLRSLGRFRIEACGLHPGRPIRAVRINGHHGAITITASAGTATVIGSPSSKRLIEAADHALYRAKHAGRNRCATDRKLIAA